MGKLNKDALRNASLTALYVIGIGAFMYYGASIKIGRSNTILIPITLLLLFVSSAAITGFLIFGKPAQLYVDGKKKEAISLLFNTLLILGAVTLFFIVLLLLFTRK